MKMPVVLATGLLLAFCPLFVQPALADLELDKLSTPYEEGVHFDPTQHPEDPDAITFKTGIEHRYKVEDLYNLDTPVSSGSYQKSVFGPYEVEYPQFDYMVEGYALYPEHFVDGLEGYY